MGARYILALVLMIAVMITWTLLVGDRFAPEQDEPPISQQTPQDGTPDENIGDQEEEPDIAESPTIPQKPGDSTVHVKTDTYNITFNAKLAIAKKWEFVEKRKNGNLRFPDRSETAKDIPFNLIPATALRCLALRLGNQSLQNKLDYRDATWEADKESIELSDTKQQDTITFTTTIAEKLKVQKRLTFYNNKSYTVDLDMTFENLTDDSEPISIGGNDTTAGYELLWGQGINADLLIHEKESGKRGRFDPKKVGAKTYIGTGKPKKELKDEFANETVRWAGLSNQYFGAFIIPDPDLQATYRLENPEPKTPPDILVTAPTETAVLTIPNFQLPSQKTQTHSYRIYVGPKDDTLLKKITAPNNNPENNPEQPINLSKVIDFGFFGPVAWAMLWLVKMLHNVFGNYGISIIILTALVKVISFPLTRKAHVSMKKMQQLQPQLLELKEKYRDDPQKLNKATMRIYKENGVNPLSGCIPWLPQIPIFWALFALLGTAVEFRGAPFLFWINDLSAPDVLVELPFTIPLIFLEIDAIRFLPLLNGLTSWLQQKFVGGMSATPPTSNMQTKIMQFLPLIFVFMFYNWASGFVLYWLCNNVFTVAQQLIQTKYFHDGETVIQETTSKRKTK